MASTLTVSTWNLTISAVEQTVVNLSTASDPLNLTQPGALTSGTTKDQGNLIYHTTLSLAGANQTIDLTSLTDAFGAVVNFARVKGFFVRNNATTDGWTVAVGNAATNSWAGLVTPGTATLIVGPAGTTNTGGWVGGWSPNATGWTVSGTSKSVMFAPGANTFTVDVVLVGSSV